LQLRARTEEGSDSAKDCAPHIVESRKNAKKLVALVALVALVMALVLALVLAQALIMAM
jgi:hypothetical protein